MGDSVNKRKIVISGVNLFEGGGLSILKKCLAELNQKSYNEYEIIAIVENKKLLEYDETSNITFVEFPCSRKSYFFRLYYEYFKFRQLSKEWDIYLWLSLHDISPFVKADIQAVYCHNPSIFRQISLKDIYYLQPVYFFFTLFYRFVYRINIHSNSFVIVQSSWMRNAFSYLFSIPIERIIVAQPNINTSNIRIKENIYIDKKNKIFFYPAFPRPFKNFEIIGDACEILFKKNITNFKIYLTINGSENKYAKYIYNRYGYLPNIEFTGQLINDRVFGLYDECDALIFPSTLETWGLPISEFKEFDKPIFLVDLPYAHETLGEYKKASFFKADKPLELAELIIKYIDNTIIFDGNKGTNIKSPFAPNWSELFKILLKKK